MNQLLEKLKNQAIIKVNNPTVNSDGKVICDNWEEVISISKFAELIVEECRYVMDCNKGSDQNPAWNQALSETSLKIKEHFGVEE